MADLAITAANVVAGADATIETGYAGAAVTAGQTVYRDAATKRYLLADSNSVTVLARSPRGVALNGAAVGQPLSVATGGTVVIGATLVAGTAYYMSDTPGGICPVADIGTGELVTLVGMATSTTVLQLSIISPGVVL